MKSYKYYLENLDCANCAKKIENEVKKNDNFKNVVVNFNTLTISFKSRIDDPFLEIVNIVKRVEPDTLLYKEKNEDNKKDCEVLRLGLAMICLLFFFVVKINIIKDLLLIAAYVFLLYKIVIKAIKKLVKSHKIDENLLMSVSAIGAYILGEYMEGLMVLLLYAVGKILEERAVNRSRSSIKELLALKVDKANLKVNDKIEIVKSENLNVGDIIVVKKGELVPVDGVVTHGSTSLDTSSLTGESLLENVNIGDKVLSGSINKGDVIEVEVTSKYVDSTAYKILELTINATNNKAKTETLVSKIAGFYTPIVLIVAIVISVVLPLCFDISVSDAIYRSLTFLVISCPCAMAISVPLSYFAGIGVASKNKILVKGSNYLDEVNSCDVVLFDKTGTITTGTLKLEKVKVFDKKYKEEDVLKIIAQGESYSTHPIAKLILNEVKEKLDTKQVKDFKEVDGKGIEYKLKSQVIKVGSASFCETKEDGNIFLTIDNKLIASLIFDDNVKENAKSVMEKLRERNIKTIMLTGDNESFAKVVTDKIKIDEYQAELMPDEKYKQLKNLKEKHKVMFVGDGINDAPSLVLANVGISMGGIGASSAIEASDVVFMNDDLENVIRILDISKKTKHIVIMNLVFAIGVKLVILGLATIGMASMWAAVFADTGVTLITIVNSLRILKS